MKKLFSDRKGITKIHIIIVIVAVIGIVAGLTIIPQFLGESATPAKFKVSNFTGSPKVVESGDMVEFSADITNSGDETGTYEVKFLVGNEVEDSQTVELEGDESTTVKFETSREELGKYSVSIEAQDSVKTGSFEVIKGYYLKINSEDGGTTNPEPGTHLYEENTEVTIEAIHDSGWRFDNWTGDYPENRYKKEITVTMDENKTVAAQFKEFIETYEIKLTASPEKGGEVIGAENYEKNQEVTIEAENVEGYEFTNWTENNEIVSGNAKLSFTAKTDRHLTANLELIKVALVKIDPPAGKVDAEETKTITATFNTPIEIIKENKVYIKASGVPIYGEITVDDIDFTVDGTDVIMEPNYPGDPSLADEATLYIEENFVRAVNYPDIKNENEVVKYQTAG